MEKNRIDIMRRRHTDDGAVKDDAYVTAAWHIPSLFGGCMLVLLDTQYWLWTKSDVSPVSMPFVDFVAQLSPDLRVHNKGVIFTDPYPHPDPENDTETTGNVPRCHRHL